MLGAILGIGSALIGASSANRAASAQTAAADRQAALAEKQFRKQNRYFRPYRAAGQNYLGALNYEMGLGDLPTIGGSTPAVSRYQIGTSGGSQQEQNPAWLAMRGGGDGAGRSFSQAGAQPAQYGFRVGGREFATREEAEAYAQSQATEGTPYRGFQETPGYQFAVDEGLGAVEGSAAARGGLYSGAAMQALQERGNQLANQEYGTYLNRLQQGANMGQAAAGSSAQASQNYTNVAGNAFADRGNASAAGAIGTGNALLGGINQGLGIWQYQNNQNQFNTSSPRLNALGNGALAGTPWWQR